MDTQTVDSREHPILALTVSMQDAVAGLAGVDPLFMPTPVKGEALGRLRRLVSSVSELYLRVLANADDLAIETALRDAGAWLAATELVDARTARADLGLAESLVDHPELAAAMARGQVSVEHARVIIRTLDALPADLAAAQAEADTRDDPDSDAGDDADSRDEAAADSEPTDEATVMARAESELIRLAGEFRPRELTRIGRHLLNVVAPELADAADEAALRRAERDAAEKTSLRLHPKGDGTTRITGTIADALAERFRTYLEAFAQPRIAGLGADGDRMPTHRLHGLALGDLLERIDPTTLPDHGGDATSVMVLLDYEDLLRRTSTAGTWTSTNPGAKTTWATQGTSPAGTDTADAAGTAPATDTVDGAAAARDAADRAAATLGEIPISAAEARRLACQAKIIPVVLDGKSQPLDLGRTKRLFTPAQRKAIRIRDRRCKADGCTAPAAWCDIHHLTPWSHGGPTDLANGIALCSHHHHKIHDTAYQHEHTPTGTIRFHPRR